MPRTCVHETTESFGIVFNEVKVKEISRNLGILGGTPVFSGTRVPIRILIEHLEAGDRLDDFLDSYPTVSRDQAIAVLKSAKMVLTTGIAMSAEDQN